MYVARAEDSDRVDRWDGRDLDGLSAARRLFARLVESGTAALYPGARSWRLFGSFTGSLSTTNYVLIGPGITSPRVWPTAAGTITCSSTDEGPLLVEYLDADGYHRSAGFTLTGSTVTAANGTGTADTAGQTVSAMRILSALWLGSSANAAAITISIGENLQVTIAAGYRASSVAAWTVPRGQRLVVSSYNASIDATKVFFGRIIAGPITLATGAFRHVVRNESAEQVEFGGLDYRPELVEALADDGAAQFGLVDLAWQAKATQSTTGTLSATARGTVMLDEQDPDPEPSKIPWVAAELARLDAVGGRPRLGP